MNQPNHYIPAVVQPGYTRCLFSANYCSTNGLVSNRQSAESQPIVLCIDRQVAELKAGEKTEAVSDTLTQMFQSAIALAEQDPLLQCVSNWLKQDLDWRPVLLNTPVSVDLTLISAESADHKIGLAFGHCAQSLPPFPAELIDIVKIQRHKKSVFVCLAQLQLSDTDKQRLQPGSCIVIPDTFKTSCKVDLCELQFGVALSQAYLDLGQCQLSQIEGVAIDQRCAQVRVLESTANHLAIDSFTRIVLEQPITVDLSDWFTPSNEPAVTVVLSPLAGQIVVVQTHQADRVQTYTAQLIEVGAGLAAVIDSTQ